MNDLWKSRDLLKEPRVKAACEELNICMYTILKGMTASEEGPRIRKSLADLAFEMRDACDPQQWLLAMFPPQNELGLMIDGEDCELARGPQAVKQRIIAATLVYEAARDKS